ncbi:MAG: four helix bundle protein [Candidatus Peribacteraceae bacterium]|nr:four helix bundle protein [Candidatus Peribacteraceae bacterium]
MPQNRRLDSGFRKLIAWQEAKALTLAIYRCTKTFPKEELFGMISQMRRAACSVMANIAEGSGMPTKVHRNSYFQRARGSVAEMDNFIELALVLQFLTPTDATRLIDHCARTSYLLTRMIQSNM